MHGGTARYNGRCVDSRSPKDRRSEDYHYVAPPAFPISSTQQMTPSDELTARSFLPSGTGWDDHLDPHRDAPLHRPLNLPQLNSWPDEVMRDHSAAFPIGDQPFGPEERSRRPSMAYTWYDDPSKRKHFDLCDEGRVSPPESSRSGKSQHQRRGGSRDEFDGQNQYLDKPAGFVEEPNEEDLPTLDISLHVEEQDGILNKVNDTLSACAFNFVAKYHFPIPIEADKRPVRVAGDREWTEWVYLLKRLATKRRIPARVLYNGQIKQLITVLENSLEMRHAAKHQSRPSKDDRNVLQLISAGLQVAKILKDGAAMTELDQLYVSTEEKIKARKIKATKEISGFQG